MHIVNEYVNVNEYGLVRTYTVCTLNVYTHMSQLSQSLASLILRAVVYASG